MSGPKGYQYTVVSAEERARREQESARRRLSAAQAAYEQAADTAAAWEGQDAARQLRPHAPEASDTAGLSAQADTWLEATRQLNQRAAQARADRLMHAVNESLGELHSPLSGPLVSLSTRRPPSEHAPQRDVQPRLDRLRDLVANHPALTETAQQVLQPLISHPPRDTDALQAAVGQAEIALTAALSTARAGERLARHRLAAEQEAADLTGSRGARLRERIRQATDEAQLRAAMADIERERQQQQVKADQSYVLNTAMEVLAELGYTTDQQELDGATEVMARNATHPDHAVKLLFRSDDASFFTNVVAVGSTSSVQDATVETETCADLSALATKMSGRGVQTRMTFHQPPGAVPVERQEQGRRRRRQVQHEREDAR